ncbi:MAG TPA: hypothetical protein VKU44_07485, partial [Terriglobia bacterium]|nr:hypothetical protein [Terriglobia bacterium]
MTIRGGAWLLLSAGVMMGQTLNNATLSGKYYFRHLLFTTDTSENITDMRSLLGAVTFDGVSSFSFTGQQTTGSNPPAALSGSGTYTMNPAGIVSLTNPQAASLTINARYGTAENNEAMVLGSSTEGAANSFDLFVAVQAPTAPASSAS